MSKKIPKYKFNSNQKIDFEITSIRAIYEKSKNQLYSPHRQEFYGLFYFKNAFGSHFVDFKAYKINIGDIFLISNEQVHYFNNIEKTDGDVLLFTSTFLDNDVLIDQIFETSVGNPQLSLHEKQYGYFDTLINHIRTIWASDKHSKSEILKRYVEILLLEIYQSNQESSLLQDINYQRFLTFKKDLKAYFKDHKKVKYYADRQFISSKTLNLATRAIVDKSAKQFINEYIVLLAKRMLINTNNTSSAIAYALGFDEPTNFTKFFKRIVSLSPSAFQKTYK